MAVAAPPNTLPITWQDAHGESDEIFHNFFNTNPKCALLACDRLGVSSSELLYRSRTAWENAVNTASHARPVSRNVDLAALAQLRYNMQERHRQQLFRELFAIRQSIFQSGNVEKLWKQRAALLAQSEGLREQLEDPPIELDPMADDVLRAEIDADRNNAVKTVTPGDTPHGRALAPPVIDAGRRTPAGAHSHHRRGSVAVVASPPPFPKRPTGPPICRFRSVEALARDEEYLEASRKSLLDFAQREAVAEKAFRRFQLTQGATATGGGGGATPAPPLTARAAPVRPLEPNQLMGESAVLPMLSSSQTARALMRGPARTMEKEFAALVRNTMDQIAKEAIADQLTHATVKEQSRDRRETQQAQSTLRRLASSPTNYSSTKSTARRPSTDGKPSDEVARARRERAFAEEVARAERFESTARERGQRVEVVKDSITSKSILHTQTTQAKHHLAQLNRQRAARAAESVRIADYEAREQRRTKAAEASEKRKEMAAAQRQQHWQMQEMRRKFAEVIERMAVEGQWSVPEELHGLIGAFDTTGAVTALAAASETPQSQPRAPRGG